MTAPTQRSTIDEHPDLMALRADSERATAQPVAQAVEGMCLLTGLYLAASPWIVGFPGFVTLAVTNLIAGLAFAFLTGGLGSAYDRTHAMSWAAVGIGLWTIVAPFVVALDVAVPSTVISNGIAGLLAVALALATAAMGAGRSRSRRR